MAIDPNPKTGAIKVNFPDLDVDELGETCTLDVADGGGATLEAVATAMNLVRERVRQLELSALAKLEQHPAVRRLLKAMRGDG
jgi:hypothetical protein